MAIMLRSGFSQLVGKDALPALQKGKKMKKPVAKKVKSATKSAGKKVAKKAAKKAC